MLLVDRPHTESQEFRGFTDLMLAPTFIPTAEEWAMHWDRGPARKKGFHSPRPGQAGSVGNMTSLMNGLSSPEKTELCRQGKRSGI